jgi:hypothetical protein
MTNIATYIWRTGVRAEGIGKRKGSALLPRPWAHRACDQPARSQDTAPGASRGRATLWGAARQRWNAPCGRSVRGES